MESPRRVVVLGLDALDPGVFRSLLKAGRLPNLAAHCGNLEPIEVRSEGLILHGSVWPTFASGTGPGTHGRFWWLQWLEEEQRFVRNSHSAFEYEPFWATAAQAGRTVVALDVPYTPVVNSAHAWTANGWGLHDEMEPASLPARFLPAVRRRYGTHPLSFDTLTPLDGRSKLRMTRELAAGLALRVRFLEDFLARSDWRFLITTCGELHKAGHYLAADEELVPGFTNLDAMADILAPLDAAWPRLLELAGDDTDVFLLSLHGMYPQVDYAGVGSQVLASLAGADPAAAVPTRDAIRRIRDLLPSRVHSAVWSLLPPGVRAARYARMRARMPAADEPFALPHDGSIAVSTRGRPPAEIAEALESLTRKLVADDGRTAFGALLEPGEMFRGPRSARLPDLLVPLNRAVFRSSAVSVPGGVRFEDPQPESRNGIHTGVGFCYLRPGAPTAPTRTTVDSRDFAPAILRRLGLEPRPGLEGTDFLT